MTTHTVYRSPPMTLLLGRRVRYVIDGAPYYGTIVHIDQFVAKWTEAFVVDEDGMMRCVRVLNMQLVDGGVPAGDPYRSTP